MDSFYEFIKNNPSTKRLRVNDLLLAEYQCPLSEVRYDIWSHHNYFIYVLSGKKKWLTTSQESIVARGDCLFVRKGAHSVHQYFDSGFCALVLFVPDAFIRSVLLRNRIKPGSTDDLAGERSLFPVKKNEQLAAYFTSFLSYLSGSDVPADHLMELKFKELLMIAASPTENKRLSSYFAILCKSTKPSLTRTMEENFSQPMSLEEYAQLSGRSLSTFRRDFKQIYDTSPGRWLTRKRLQLAKYLLAHTKKPVSEIVLDAGFKNGSHFSRIFKEQFDATPVEWRKSSNAA